MNENSEIVIRLITEVQLQGNLDLLDELPAHGAASAPAGARLGLTRLRTALTGLQVAVLEKVEQGDKMVTRRRVSGTESAPLLGVPAKRRRVSVESIEIVRVVDGRLRERWAIGDQLGLMRQMGAIAAAS